MPAATVSGLEGVIAAESRICFIDGEAGILSYQGYDIRTLGEKATFEEVIFLLWHGRLPKQAELDELKAGWWRIARFPRVLNPSSRMCRKAPCRWQCCARPYPCWRCTIRWPRTCRWKPTRPRP